MRKSVINLHDQQHSPIVFSTAVPNEVFSAYSRWLQSSAESGRCENKGSAWIKFCAACESFGLFPLVAVNLINK